MINNQPLKILLIGATGQVGFELCRTLAPLGQLISVARQGTKITLDLIDADNIKAVIKAVKPHLIVNAAAYTNVNQAETDQLIAQKINADAVGIIGECAKKINASVVHYSTDYVYAGDGHTAWQETDKTAPLNIYGKTKLDGEKYLLQSDADSLILRTSWVYGMRGNNFLLTMQRLLAEKDKISVVNDEIGAPTWSRMIAEATSAILAQKIKQQFKFEQDAGIYNFSAIGETSWYKFAVTIRDLSAISCDIEAIAAAAYPSAAARPKNSRLNHDKLARVFHIKFPHWHDSLICCVDE